MTTKKKQDDAPEPQAFGVFENTDGRQVVAETIDDAVRYRFDGWQEVAPATPDNAEPTPDPSA